MADNEKKIIVDEDWKKQAQQEKQKLAAESKDEKETQQEEKPLPKGDFNALVSMLATQTLFSLGVIAPRGKEEDMKPDLKLAKYNIDLLEALEEKTKGNLADDEKEMLEGALSQLRMAYVQISSQEE